MTTQEPQGEYQHMGNWGGLVKYGDDKNLAVFFYRRSVPNALKSEQAGTRFHDEVDYIKMFAPGEQLQVIDRPVTDADKRRFPVQWRAYENNRRQIVDGIPVDMLFPSYPAIADNLRSCGVHTVEQCANLSASAVDSIGMGAQEYQNRAKDYLEAAKAGSNYHKFKAQLDEKDRELKRLRDQVAALSAQFAAVMGQLQQGLPVPSAMIPQKGIPGIPNFQPLQPQAQGLPIRGEAKPEVEPRKDLMADLPPAGKINKFWATAAAVEEDAGADA
jgi:hypothetical protein